MVDQTANFVRGETDSSVSAGDTTISVVDATEFPDPTNGEYNLALWNGDGRPDQDPDAELVRVTGRDTGTNDLTVTRAQEGTSDVSHPTGSALQLGTSAKVINDLDNQIQTEVETATISNGTVETPISGFDLSTITNLLSVEVTPDPSGNTDIFVERNVLPSDEVGPNVSFETLIAGNNTLDVNVENNVGEQITVTAVVSYQP